MSKCKWQLKKKRREKYSNTRGDGKWVEGRILLKGGGSKGGGWVGLWGGNPPPRRP